MPSSTRSTLRLLATLVASAVTAAAPAACGGKDESSTDAGGDEPDGAGQVDADASSVFSPDAGPEGDDSSTYDATSSGGDDADAEGEASSGGSGSGSGSSSGYCPVITTMTYPVDAAACEPQLQQELWANDAACQWNIEQPCSPEAGVTDGGAGDASTDASNPCSACSLYTDAAFGNACSYSTNAAGVLTIECGYCCIGGRAPRGFVPDDSRGARAAGAHLSRMAQLEAASVDAFLALHADLERAGAPRSLLARVRAAARDEVRHARDVCRVARRFGAGVPSARVHPIGPRSLEQLATENAEQGCIEETFGAAVAAAQARHAKDPSVRRLMRTIARDELRHAALAWDIARWLDARLDVDTRDRVRDARLAALRKLDGQVAHGGAGDDALGLPDARSTRAVLRRMWAPLATGQLESGPRLDC